VSSVLIGFGSALALTVAIELAVVAALGGRSADELAAVALVNVITNPTLNFALLLFRGLVLSSLRPASATVAEWAFIAVAEIAVVLVEWRLLAWALRADSRTWLVRSAVMNATSFVLGTWLLWVALPALVR
jgi:hypothetical protein